MRVLAIARNTFRENIRDKVLYNLVLFALLMILSSLALGQLTLGHTDKVIVDLGLSSISMIGTLIAIFIGISLVYKEIEKRTVYALLAKPVRRGEFILGKFLGLLFTLAVNVFIMSTGLIVTLAYHGVGPRSWVRILPAVFLILLSLALTTAVALVFSTFSTPALSALFTFFIWVIGHFNVDLLELGRMMQSAPFLRICRVLYYLLPNYSNFSNVDSRNVIATAAYYQPIDGWAVLWSTAYALIYCGVLLGISMAIFSRRDFK